MTALRAGQTLDGTSYQVVREIGAGGMGVVYEVEHVRLRKRYVAKVIHEQIRGDDGAQKRMEREAQVLAAINHPNVVQVHDVGVMADGTSYFVMERLDGIDLRQAMKRGSVGRARALTIIIDVLDALEHVHRRGIVHRDIKPDNIFLSQQPTGIATKVLDFGIVHIFDDGRSSQDRITKTGGFVGTFYYAAPEQMRGEPAGPPNDVYACGLVLYELLAGRGPFDDDAGLGLSRCFTPAPRLDETTFISRALVDAIADTLELEPEKRPTAGALAARLRAVLANASTMPGFGEAAAPLRADVDDLLANMPLESARELAATQMPPTPLMPGAPGRVTPSIPPTIASNAPPPPSSNQRGLSTGYQPTIGSAMFAPATSTSAGLYATVDRSGMTTVVPTASRGVMIAVITAFLFVLGVGATLVVRIVWTGTRPSAPAAVVAPPPPPIVTIPAVEPAVDPPPPPQATAAAAPAASSAKPVMTAKQPAAQPPKKGNAKKDGYVEDL